MYFGVRYNPFVCPNAIKIPHSVLAYRKSCVIGRQVDAPLGIGNVSRDRLRKHSVESSGNYGDRVLFDIIRGSGYYAWTG